MKRRLIPAAALLAAATAMSAGGLLSLPAHAAGASRHIVPNVAPSWATRTSDRGSLAASSVIGARVYLASRNEAGLNAFVRAVSTPGSALFHHYLTPAQSWARFGSLPGAAGQVSSWLKSTGLHVTASNKHYVAFRGSAATVDAAFGTSLHSFTVGGKQVYAPSGQVSVPSSLARDVLTVTGLYSQLVANRPMAISDSHPVAPNAKAFPCSAYEGQKQAKQYPKAYGKVQPFAVCGYGPQQLAGAYGATASGFTGKGFTVAVVDGFALPTMAKDLNQWDKNRGWQAVKKGQYKEYIPSGTGYNAGWGQEEALDVEAIHSMAPDAGIAYVAAQTPSDNFFMDAYNTIIDKKLADAVNNSWEGGTDAQEGQATITAYENIFKMGATEGIGFYFSTGDGGGAGGTLFPSVDPFATGVGGSAIGISKTNGYMWETDWETDYSSLAKSGKSWTPAPPGVFQSGTGGGTATVFKQPSWQKGVVPKKFSEANGKTPMRTTPDIAAEADPTTGFLQGFSTMVGGKFVYGETRIGGTSLSSPLIVGMQADAEQAAGSSLGFANPAIYALYGSKSYNDVIADPLGKGVMIAHVRMADLGSGNVVAIATAGQAADGQLASVKGYDTTTGVGTPTEAYFKSFAALH